MSVADLPTLNASLNGVAALFLLAGYAFIRRRKIGAHRAAMLGAFAASALFLISYVIYHANAGSKPFPGTGPIRVVYFVILITHVVLAVVILPMALTTLSRALRGQFDRHVRIARRTLPIWLYVSVTGVVIYLMLYQGLGAGRWAEAAGGRGGSHLSGGRTGEGHPSTDGNAPDRTRGRSEAGGQAPVRAH